MSVFHQGERWRFDFTLKGARYTSPVQNKNRGQRAEFKRKEAIQKPKPEKEIPTDMGFLELINKTAGSCESI